MAQARVEQKWKCGGMGSMGAMVAAAFTEKKTMTRRRPPQEWRLLISGAAAPEDKRRLGENQCYDTMLDGEGECKYECSKQQINIHNRDKCNGGPLQVADEPSPEAVPKAPKSSVSNVEDHDDRSKPPLIQQRGRFKVTPGNVELDKAHPSGLQKCHSMQAISHLPTLSIPSSAEAASSIIGGSLYMQLYSVLQTNMLQREQILHAMKQLSGCDFASPACIPSSSRSTSPSSALSVDRSMLEAAHEKEKEMLNEILELQWRLVCSQDEVQRLKAKAAQI